jgi:hypothetical protein
MPAAFCLILRRQKADLAFNPLPFYGGVAAIFAL